MPVQLPVTKPASCLSQIVPLGILTLLSIIPSIGLAAAPEPHSVLVEAESLRDAGGWKLDTQSIETMGSPYLLAHGLGRPVKDATGQVTLPATGKYHVYVRTKDWVAQWRAPGQPGRFQVMVNGRALPNTLGTEGAEWHWQYAGQVQCDQASVQLQLHDLTGFEGRCDAVFFSTEQTPPPNESRVLGQWRQKQLGLPEQPKVHDKYDLVVVGGGYSGMGTAISAARAGCRVALIQNRGVLGGNGSSEVRVWAQGLIRRGKYPRIGEMVEEFSDHAKKSPGTYEEFEDAKKEQLVRAEPNIDLFLHHHAYAVQVKDARIAEITTLDTRTSARHRFAAALFADCTGHGTLGALAEADWEMTPRGRMGMSNMWAWAEGDEEVDFPETPWALDLDMQDFPYPRDHHGQWFWEGGFDKDPLTEAESIRDWNLRAVYGAFNAMKNRGGAAKHRRAYLTWIAYIGGPRESRRLLGDVVLTQDDVVNKVDFPDGCVPSTWSIDLHYPKKQFAKKFPDNPFISYAVHDRRIDRNFGYPVPYRCFYSRNINNLFMAGRCISVTHQALGTTRVMKTCGMMGEVVGKAASICVLHDCDPRGVYARHWKEMEQLLQLPGKARRATVHEPFVTPDDALPAAGAHGPVSGINPASLKGHVCDDRQAEQAGGWTEGTGLKGYVGWGYRYAGADSGAWMRFRFKPTQPGRYQVRLAYQSHENRGTRVPIKLLVAGRPHQLKMNMTEPPYKDGFTTLGRYDVTADDVKSKGEITVELRTEGAGGYVHADAVHFVRE